MCRAGSAKNYATFHKKIFPDQGFGQTTVEKGLLAACESVRQEDRLPAIIVKSFNFNEWSVPVLKTCFDQGQSRHMNFPVRTSLQGTFPNTFQSWLETRMDEYKQKLTEGAQQRLAKLAESLLKKEVEGAQLYKRFDPGMKRLPETLTELEKLFRKRSLKVHPDREKDQSKKAEATSAYQDMQLAYDEIRKKYDESGKLKV
uniref:J domain-containing protein n=1 Tax=Chromera velia CCMP2878 TaxID=1169474 RepID=A0A0G4H935_9ALVE|eukprot:Cvel_25141.t1-p1 / transcript=Cvel_25141.t1 / gene=Cvel_25141 / organism=Chromera_velia_CCMP2878 / gene_product=hypothetical protein / transcript_product=hypothetical protein / location=Cvel_scaffold2811:1534-2133(-) / protein_length=200 / sequence_SO=supercontig / SO=protein_coding / is_pseudo=false